MSAPPNFLSMWLPFLRLPLYQSKHKTKHLLDATIPPFLNLRNSYITVFVFSFQMGSGGGWGRGREWSVDRIRSGLGFLTWLGFSTVPAPLRLLHLLKLPHSHSCLVSSSWLLNRVSGAWAGLATARQVLSFNSSPTPTPLLIDSLAPETHAPTEPGCRLWSKSQVQTQNSGMDSGVQRPRPDHWKNSLQGFLLSPRKEHSEEISTARVAGWQLTVSEAGGQHPNPWLCPSHIPKEATEGVGMGRGCCLWSSTPGLPTPTLRSSVPLSGGCCCWSCWLLSFEGVFVCSKENTWLRGLGVGFVYLLCFVFLRVRKDRWPSKSDLFECTAAWAEAVYLRAWQRRKGAQSETPRPGSLLCAHLPWWNNAQRTEHAQWSLRRSCLAAGEMAQLS